ncbi:diaminopimelate decarboxylase [Bengtsoniella intestinalis]|uniref:diaminopimelate decarboxylase n=1 Tax=Bengtsoniella intestinalis TaxID=3073143 RepID=UPI00391F4E81
MIKEVKNGVLYFDGCNTVELAKEYGTPLYLMSESDIVGQFTQLKDCFLSKYTNTRVAYAAKAFSPMAMFAICQREGMCIDVVSGGELYTAMKIGFPAERIEFNGNNKLPCELEAAIDYGIGRIIIDGLQELALIERICREKGKKVQVLYRVTPGVKSDSHDYIVTGKKDSKFGIPLDEDVIFPAVEAAIASDYVDFLGFHFHVGSQLHDNGSHLQALDIILNLVKQVKEHLGYDVTELNLGGGFGVVYTDENRKPYSYFMTPMMEKIEGFFTDLGVVRPAIVIEPGRSIVAEAGISLYTIGSIKDIRGVRKYVSVDGGMTDNIRPALYQAQYRGVIANKADAEPTETVTICGKCCESGDVLIRDIGLPEAEAGDTFAIFSTGAYGLTMASNYNKNPIPAVVLLKEGSHKLIVRRQSYEDMLACEVLPE